MRKREDGRNARTVANDKYNRQNYTQVKMSLPKGSNEVLKRAAAAQGVSMTQYICNAIKQTYDIDLWDRDI